MVANATEFEEREAAFARLRAVEWESGEGDGIVKEPVEMPADAVLREAPTFEPEPAPEITYASRPPAMSIPLAWPLSVDGQPVRRIDLRPPAFGDVEQVLSGAMSELEMYAKMAGVPVAILRGLRWDDSEKVTIAARQLAPEIRRG